MLKGSLGLPLVGETVSFLRDPVSFVSSRLARYGAVFRTNVLAHPTIVACTYAAALDVLHPSTGTAAEAGDAYTEFLGPLYPVPNQLLLNSDSDLRASLIHKFGPVFAENAVCGYRPTIAALARDVMDKLSNANIYRPTVAAIARDRLEEISGGIVRIPLYETFKPLCERVVTTLLLGELPEHVMQEVRALCSTHFRALIAVPLHVDVLGRRSARANATRARKRLLRIILSAISAECERQHVENITSEIADENDPQNATHPTPFAALVARIGGVHASPTDRALLADHILLLLSSAVPKSIASGIVSLFVALSAPGGPPLSVEDAPSLRAALLEALRLHPPLLGGLRVTRDDGACVVSGIQMPARHRLWYSALHANRDKDVYSDADEFHPERWDGATKSSGCPFARLTRQKGNDEPPIPLTFGAGTRACPGKFLAWEVMLIIAEEVCDVGEILQRTQSAESVTTEMRYLPVCRPVEDIVVEIRKRNARR